MSQSKSSINHKLGCIRGGKKREGEKEGKDEKEKRLKEEELPYNYL